MAVTTPTRQGKIALFMGVVFCAITVVLTGYIFTLGPQSDQDRQWFLLLVAIPVVIQFYLNRAVILSHLRSHWYLWAITTVVFLGVGLQFNYAQVRSSSSMADMLRNHFFAWVDGQSCSSEIVSFPAIADDGAQVMLRIDDAGRLDWGLKDYINYYFH